MTVAAIKDTPLTHSPWAAPVAAFGAFAVACAALLHPTALEMVKIWSSSSSYHHGFAVAPIALWMILSQSRRLPAPSTGLTATVIVFAAAIVWLLGHAAGVALVEQLAFVSLLIGGAGVIFGTAALREWAFPLLFLFFMVPFGETIIPALQTITAVAVVGLLSMLGMAVSLDGYLIRTPAGSFEVAEACAGLRFLLAAMMVAAIFAYASFTSWRKRILFLVFSVVLAIAANGVRAFLLVMIATLTEKRWAVGPDHLLVGWVFYAAIFIVLILVGRRFADTGSLDTEKSPPSINPEWRLLALAPAFAVVALAALYGTAVIDRPVTRAAPVTLSLLNAPGWRILPPPQNWRASLPTADRIAAATYSSPDDTVYASLAYFTHDRHGAEIVEYSNRAWDGADWRRIASRQEVIYVFGHSQTIKIDILAGPERRRLATLTAYWLGDEIYLERWRIKLAQMKAKLMGTNPPGGVIIFAAAYQQHPDEAITALRAFTVSAEPFGDWLQRNGGG